MKKDDLIGIIGGLVCLGLSQVDAAWSGFWLIAGVVLLVWSIRTALRRRKSGRR